MLFPFFFLTLSLGGGILLSSFVSFPLAAGIASMTGCLIFSWIFFLALRKTKLAFVFILLACLFLGWSWHTYWNHTFKHNPLKTLVSEGYIDFQGKLYKSLARGHETDYLFLKVEKINADNQEKKMRGNLRISMPHVLEASSMLDLHNHDKIKVSAKFTSSQGFNNFSSSELDQYLKIQNIHKRAYTKSPLLIEKLSAGKKTSLPRTISIIRRKLQLGIESHFANPQGTGLSPEGSIIEALLLGERRRMEPGISRGLQQAGIFHLFAISGAHIAIISLLLFSVFRFLKIPDRINYTVLIFFLIFYAILVEGRPSVMRATIMALAFIIGKLIWRKVNLLNTLSISAFIILMWNPSNLFSLGFQLTFVATLSIILFFPKVVSYLPRLPLKISEIFALSVSAQLGVLPFIALAFNRISFSSLILNLAAIPLVGLIMTSGYIFLLLALIIPVVAGPCANLVYFLVRLLIAVSHILDPVPGLSFRIPTPPFFVVLGYFSALGLMLLPTKLKIQKTITFICFVIFFGFLVVHPFPSHSKTLKLTFIDVGQGDSILVEFPGRKKMLIDGGGIPEDTFDIGERIVSPFLWKKGIKKINYLVLTHAHPDHLNGLKAVARNFGIDEFWEAFSPKDHPSYGEFTRWLPKPTIFRRMFRGHIEHIADTKIEILNPPQANPIVAKVLNDQSLVLRISYGRTAFLLAGDIGKEMEKDLVQSQSILQCDVLKSPHHGSGSSSSEEFLAAVAPRFVILSVGAGNRYDLPDPVVISRYQKIGAKLYRTDLCGAVEVSSNGQDIFFRTPSVNH